MVTVHSDHDLLQHLQELPYFELRAFAQAYIYEAQAHGGDEGKAAAEYLVGYLTGYMSQARSNEVRRATGIGHPVYGFANPTPLQCFVAGQLRAMGATDEMLRAILDPQDR